MPKGGAERYEKKIGQETELGRARHEELKGALEPQYNTFWQNYNNVVTRQGKDYGNFMGRFNEFANTVGFSPQDISNIRSRAVSPLRASYAAASRNVERQKSLQGGYSPGSNVLQARMAREQGQAMSDVTRKAEADIAEMKQRGRLAGISGLLSGYGATPGQASLYGNQSLAGMGQRLNLGQNQDQFAQGILGHWGQQGQMTGKWQQGLNNTLNIAKTAGQLIYPWMNQLPTGNLPSGGNPMVRA